MLGLRERMEENGSAPGTGEAKRSAAAPADPEVVDRPLRRRFSPSYKLRIVEEADRCTEPGEVGQVLRREGLYSSHLTTWRKAAHSGSLKALSKKRGRKPERNPLDEKVRKLERRNARLENELRKAHLIIDVDDPVRLRCSRVWVVDPIDGTREFVQRPVQRTHDVSCSGLRGAGSGTPGAAHPSRVQEARVDGHGAEPRSGAFPSDSSRRVLPWPAASTTP